MIDLHISIPGYFFVVLTVWIILGWAYLVASTVAVIQEYRLKRLRRVER